MLKDPPPAEVLQLLSCGCKKSKCMTGSCICRSHGLKCSDLCSCQDCNNSLEEASEDESDEGSESGSDENDADGDYDVNECLNFNT